MHDITVLVAGDLHLQVPWPGHQFFDQKRGIAEGGFGFLSRQIDGRGQVGAPEHPPHALSTTARRGLDHHRKADALGLVRKTLRRLVRAEIARHARHASSISDQF
jgi:hypothetical protein